MPIPVSQFLPPSLPGVHMFALYVCVSILFLQIRSSIPWVLTHFGILAWESHGQEEPVDYSPYGHEESDITETP